MNFVLKTVVWVTLEYLSGLGGWFGGPIMLWLPDLERNLITRSPLYLGEIASEQVSDSVGHVRPNKFGGLQPYVYTGFNGFYLLIQTLPNH